MHDSSLQTVPAGSADPGPAPEIVLVGPAMGENIGAAARVMLNFGLTGLGLVNPRDGWPNPKAGAMAAGAADVLDAVRVYPDTGTAVRDFHFVAGATARRRDLLLPVVPPDGLVRALSARIAAGQKCAIMFGNERYGLDNDDLAHCHAIVSVPVNPGFSSLNLAQAVGVMAYEWSRSGRTLSAGLPSADGCMPAPAGSIARLADQLVAALDRAGYFFPARRRPVMERNLRIALSRTGFTGQQVRMMQGVVKALARFRDTP